MNARFQVVHKHQAVNQTSAKAAKRASSPACWDLQLARKPRTQWILLNPSDRSRKQANCSHDPTCVKISPDVSTTWEDDDSLAQGRSMGSMVGLPDLKILLLNGADIKQADYKKNIAISIAKQFQHTQIVEELKRFATTIGETLF